MRGARLAGTPSDPWEVKMQLSAGFFVFMLFSLVAAWAGYAIGGFAVAIAIWFSLLAIMIVITSGVGEIVEALKKIKE